MDFPESIKQQTCMDCLSGQSLGFDIRMAFQPIVDVAKRKIVSYEALVRGPEGQGAGWVFERVNEDNRYYFDQACRVKAIETAARLGCETYLNINFLPNAVYNPETCIQATIEAADLYHFDLTKLIFEVTESEQIIDKDHLQNIFSSYSQRGFKTAIDDYGSGFSRLDWLTDLRPDILKLDMELIRDIHLHPEKRDVIRAAIEQCNLQGTQVLAEGIESWEELECLLTFGIHLFQGYYFAKPQLEALALVPFDELMERS